MDTGYHIAKPVVVMEDSCEPETGWFQPDATNAVNKWYKYEWHSSGNYVTWRSKTTKGEQTVEESALIYIGRVFRSTADTTERRNLLYPFKSWLKRDENGVIKAGFYFGLKIFEEASVTFLYTDPSSKQIRRKFSFKDLTSGALTADKMCDIDICTSQLRKDSLEPFIKEIVEAISDENFLSEVLTLNQRILDEISGDN
ncbi:uncharacterized protein LOC136027450 [Artemia franciscana]